MPPQAALTRPESNEDDLLPRLHGWLRKQVNAKRPLEQDRATQRELKQARCQFSCWVDANGKDEGVVLFCVYRGIVTLYPSVDKTHAAYIRA